MAANTPNYVEQGGAVSVIGGELRIKAGGRITSDGSQPDAIADVADDLATDADGTAISVAVNNNAGAINDILAVLRGAGLIATE